jgi:hypothetical protein
MASDLLRWRADPAAFVREVLRDPETRKAFQLYPAQETFLRAAFQNQVRGCRL